ncbi:MAG TPA: MFS transporter [Candidatus Acidoferrales bacterium]|nr:MFS transporter [Candidatus Acidoferrales bacterium]
MIASPAPVARPERRRAALRSPWVRLLVIYGVASFVEAFGVSQIFAFMLLNLQGMGVRSADIGRTIGVLSSLVFVLGLPIVPLWGVWADKYSRKAVIIRSALVEAVVFGAVALSRTPWQLGLSLLLVGFQLGNTGVMLAAIRDATPRRRLGSAIALFGATSTVGMSVGPWVGGVMLSGLRWPVSSVYWLSAALSVGVALLLAFGSTEVRPEVVPQGSVRSLAYGAVRGVLADAAVRRLFLVFGLAFFARQIANPFLPLLVERLVGQGSGLAGSIGLVTGVAALVGGLVSPIAGPLGDRFGFRPVLAVSFAGGALGLCLMPFMPGVGALAVAVVAWSAFVASVSAMIFGLLAVEVSPDRRSATLNLVYLPLYVAGIVGPSIGAALVGAGLDAVFEGAAVLLAAGAVAVGLPLVAGRIRRSSAG